MKTLIKKAWYYAYVVVDWAVKNRGKLELLRAYLAKKAQA